MNLIKEIPLSIELSSVMKVIGCARRLMVEVLIVNVLNGVRVWQSLKKCVTL